MEFDPSDEEEDAELDYVRGPQLLTDAEAERVDEFFKLFAGGRRLACTEEANGDIIVVCFL